jgi:uncharacterized protein YjeT (DUF2065 family)
VHRVEVMEIATIVWTAIGLLVAVEGILLSLFPELLREMAVKINTMPAETIKIAGLVAAITGVFMLWLALG